MILKAESSSSYFCSNLPIILLIVSGSTPETLDNSFKVKNLGRGSLSYTASMTDSPADQYSLRDPDDFKITPSPSSGVVTNGDDDSITLSWNIPSYLDSTDTNLRWKFKVYSSTTKESEEIDLYIDIANIAKPKAMPLYTMFQERFPFLFILFQSLSMF